MEKHPGSQLAVLTQTWEVWVSVGWFRASLSWWEPNEVGEEAGTTIALVLSPRGYSSSYLQPCFKTMDNERE